MTLEMMDAFFQSPEGKVVDVAFTTKDDKVFFLPDEAQEHADRIAEYEGIRTTPVITWYRNETEARIHGMNTMDTPLHRMITLTNYIKKHKAQRMKAPDYESYKLACARHRMTPVSKESFDFVVANVYKHTSWVQNVFQTDMERIHIEEDGTSKIVTARLIKAYPDTKLFLYKDSLIMTCPTNIELMRGEIYEMYAAVMLTPAQRKVGALMHHPV